MKPTWIAFGALLTVPLGVTAVHAHHSFAASFTDERIMREGVVERYVFKNPHVLLYIAVAGDDGDSETWMVEGGSATGLRRAGWSADTLSIGDHVRINGRAGRNNRPMISMESVAVLDPASNIELRDLPLDNFAEGTESAEILSIPLTLDDGLPNLTGTWGRGRGRPAFFDHRLPPFNEAGAAMQAEWDPASDPQVACEDPTLIRQAGFTPHPVR
ncbi:MAG: hypothetical protein F4053_09515, partial [Proteobacteria bacterium]|nr:hypothetical protein [Pseudomonadota bacterium]